MGLMHLLTVTRSLSEAKDRPHRYKLMSEGWPTFGNAVVEQSGEQDAGVTAERDAMKTEMTAEQNVTTKQAFPLGRWTKNPFRSTAMPSQRASIVQGELSLDKVKPVRNDLCDSDLDLIPRKAAQQENVFAATVPATGTEIAQKLSLFSRVKARLFRGKAG
ncbi:MAG TPA: hypothetical protein VK530_10135 [Candidatus Acidoferrum sp.]|nr:hypothetical protein [Candidatus Acidoferrum sp.]